MRTIAAYTDADSRLSGLAWSEGRRYYQMNPMNSPLAMAMP